MQFVIAAVLVTVVSVVALVLRRRQAIDPPTQQRWQVPAQLDRADFPTATADWIVVAFTSSSCSTCADITRKAAVLASQQVCVVNVDFTVAGDLHRRYKIDAVPTVVIADKAGVVKASFLGPVSATDLWAAVAEARAPGTSPEPGLGQ
jgi:hypothetical protein